MINDVIDVIFGLIMLVVAIFVQIAITKFCLSRMGLPKTRVKIVERPVLPDDYDFTEDTIARIDRELAREVRKQYWKGREYDPNAFDSHGDFEELTVDGRVVKRVATISDEELRVRFPRIARRL